MSIYVTGTDTGIGKTWVCRILIERLVASGVRALGMKPVASGSRMTPYGLRNDDAEILQAAGASRADYDDINPYAFADPIAPHLAARDAATPIDLARIEAAYRRLCAHADELVVEGVGGWAAPLGDSLTQAHVVRALGLDVVLVVGMRLGCINHAMLTARAIAADGCVLAGWIANRVEPSMLRFDDNLQTLRERIGARLLDVVEYADPNTASAFVRD